MGSAIKKSGIPREEIFLTTKVWIEHYGYEECKVSIEESMRKLQTDYLVKRWDGEVIYYGFRLKNMVQGKQYW